MRKITAILIDPFNQTIKPVTYDGDDHTAIYPLLSHEGGAVDTMDAVYCKWFRGRDAALVDDEGLFKDPRHFILFDGCDPIAGKALLVGADDDGDSVAPKTTLADVYQHVNFGIAPKCFRARPMKQGGDQ